MLADTLAGPVGWNICTRPLHVALSSSQRDDWVQVWVSYNREGKPGRSCITFYDLALEVIQCDFHPILFIRREFLRLTHTQGKGT